ncbi:YeiH family protein [Shewanella sp. NIFS-20-20]|uniref:YeiH family protein n=1 Tax=Shewanella sp. NIFS-20-20 TaxID=2853806 RepID=UPI001C481C7B|nr:putative sulfate exporter family transporter [Shewanella sp. NIFS-20-20]MBV7315680.1 putative sulfate exporter family transporter [Shewanella sp. NIFS-20-20]
MALFSQRPWQFWLFVALAFSCLLPVMTSPLALILGFALANLGWVPTSIDVGRLTKRLLSLSIIGLGFGINLQQAIEVSSQGLPLIVGSIVTTLLLTLALTKLLNIDAKTGYLIGAGTAICGGSAIAAVAPAINAKNDQMAVALACVFILNALALFVFPVLGHALEMSQYDFGLWAAIAIHDTSSVVGAASSFGEEALVTATTVKLARALWIIPLALVSTWLFKGKNQQFSVPYFIIWYLVAMVFCYLLPQGASVYQLIFEVAKRTLVVCLFLIGAGITVAKMKQTGYRPMLLAVLLWLAIASGSLWAIY